MQAHRSMAKHSKPLRPTVFNWRKAHISFALCMTLFCCTVSWARAVPSVPPGFLNRETSGNLEQILEDQLHFREVMQQVLAEENIDLLDRGSAIPLHAAEEGEEAGATIPNVPDYELQALRDLYDSAGGAQWHWYNFTVAGTNFLSGIPWDFNTTSPNPCYPKLWQGIFCTPQAVNNTLHIVLFELVLHNLQGQIPPTFYNLTQLVGLSLSGNRLTGTIAPEISRLTRLRAINYSNNKLSGTLPEELGSLAALAYLYLFRNVFSGTLPTSFAGLFSIKNLYLYDNEFTGSIPEVLGEMPSLTSLDMGNNKLDGTLPLSLLKIPLNILLLSGNALTGTIPAELGSMITLQSLQLARNELTGSIPSSFGQLRNLTNLYVHYNHLHGSIPEEVGYMSSLVYFFAQDNQLSGSLPRSLSHLPLLGTLFLQDNAFTGTLYGVFNGSTQPLLGLLQLSNNQLTGPVPDSLFQLPELQVLSLVSNCFSGSVPTSICSSRSLSALSMDGLRSASSCQRVMLPRISTAYVLTSKFEDGVPPCLFAMPNLVTLHLSGNGLTGTLPNIANVSDNLIDLALSHNKLTGTIPHAFQRRLWYNLDLSYNKLSGTLFEDLGTINANYSYVLNAVRIPVINATKKFDVIATSLSLRNNRLSSFVPDTVINMVNISLLAGNVFDCNLDGRDLPTHDSGKDTYQCGSASFNISYYLWLACVLTVVLIAFVIYYWRQRFESLLGGVFIAITNIKRWLSIVRWYDLEHRSEVRRLQHYKYVLKVSEAVCKVALWCTVFIVVLFMPLYAILSSQYGTHTYTYAYTVSAAFLSGNVSGALMLVWFAALLIMLLVRFRIDFTTLSRDLQELPHERGTVETSADAPAQRATWQERTAIYMAFFLINFAVVLGANIAYLYVVLYENSAYNTAAQISLSVFKLMWNNLGALYLMRWTRHRVASSTEDWKSDGGGFFALQLFVALFNFIAIPCLVVAAVNPDCFNSMLVDAPTVESSFIYEACLSFSVRFGCLAFEPTVGTTSYSPPFTYSFECSSSLITYYAPSFVYMALIVTFVNPALDVLMQQAHHRRTRGTWVAGQLDYWVPLIVQDVAAEEGAEKSAHSIYNPYFDANQLLITVVAYLGVLLTFGLVFPPIAVAMLVSIYAAVYTGKIEVGRFLTNAIDQNLHKYLDVVESECLGVGTVVKLRNSAMMLLTFTCVFYTPFVFDTLGDSAGVSKAAWVLVVLPLLPGTIYLAALACDTYQHGRERAVKLGEVAIELQETGLSSAKDLVNRVQVGLSVGRTTKTAEEKFVDSVVASGGAGDANGDRDSGGDSAYTLNALQFQSHESQQ